MTRTATPRRPIEASPRRRGDLDRPRDALGDQRFVIRGSAWESYVAINDALVERPGVRMIYCDGRLTLLTEVAEARLVRASAWVSSSSRWPQDLKSIGKTPGRRPFDGEKKSAGVEGDRDVLLRRTRRDDARAWRISTSRSQPPPDLAIEVEVIAIRPMTRSIVWGRLGVPRCGDSTRSPDDMLVLEPAPRDGTYAPIGAQPGLSDAHAGTDVVDQIATGGRARRRRDWFEQLRRWVRKVIVPEARSTAEAPVVISCGSNPIAIHQRSTPGTFDERQPSQHFPETAQRDVARPGRQGEPRRRADDRPGHDARPDRRGRGRRHQVRRRRHLPLRPAHQHRHQRRRPQGGGRQDRGQGLRGRLGGRAGLVRRLGDGR